MQSVSTRNAIAHAVHRYETQRIRNPQGRRRKLSVAYILERRFYVCKFWMPMVSVRCSRISTQNCTGTRSLHLSGMLQMLFEDGREADWR